MLEVTYSFVNTWSISLDRIVSRVLGVIIITMFSVLLLQVICRYFFSSPLTWPEEVTMFLMAWMSFFGASVALRRWSHIGVDLVLDKLSGKKRIYLLLFVRLVVLAFVFFLFQEGLAYALESANMLSDGLRIPMLYPRLSIPVGSFLMCLHTIALILGDIRSLRHQEE